MKTNAVVTESRQVLCNEAILYVLRYYALFHYPLDIREIIGNCSVVCDYQEAKQSLDELCLIGRAYSYKGCYSTDANIGALVERRIKANKLAIKKIKQACHAGRLVACFPFVLFVGISGSLSKGYADHKSDFDFFIITSEQRLWICRTLLHVFKKLTFLFGLQNKFCMNYFIDISRLKLEEQNIYTAIELSGLIPVSGKKTYETLMYENREWVRSFLPNGYQSFYVPQKIFNGISVLQSISEILLYPVGIRFNKYLMNLTDKRWRRKWQKKNYPATDYDLAFKTTLYQSKNHPANFQKKILGRLKGEDE